MGDLVKELLYQWAEVMEAEDRERMKYKAFMANQRRYWDGDVIRRTGEVIPRESA